MANLQRHRENTSESVLQTLLELCNITLNNLYLLLKFNLGANFCKVRRPTDTVREQFLLSTHCFHAGDAAAADRFLTSRRRRKKNSNGAHL